MLHQDLVLLQAVPVAIPTYSLAIPNNAALIGGARIDGALIGGALIDGALFAQGAALVPGVNPFLGRTSNGAKGTVGTE